MVFNFDLDGGPSFQLFLFLVVKVWVRFSFVVRPQGRVFGNS